MIAWKLDDLTKMRTCDGSPSLLPNAFNWRSAWVTSPGESKNNTLRGN